MHDFADARIMKYFPQVFGQFLYKLLVCSIATRTQQIYYEIFL